MCQILPSFSNDLSPKPNVVNGLNSIPWKLALGKCDDCERYFRHKHILKYEDGVKICEDCIKEYNDDYDLPWTY